MRLRCEVRAFFFNAKTDYLPYYLPFKIELDQNATTTDLLHAIKSQEERFSFDENKPFFRINGIVVDTPSPLASIIDRFGAEFQIDPLSLYRSQNGLVIRDEDFEASFAILSDLCDEEDRRFYDALYPLYYASATFELRHEYWGDALFLLADRLIRKSPEHTDEILRRISDLDHGIEACEFEVRTLSGNDYTDTIEALKTLLRTRKEGLGAILSRLVKPNIPQTPKNVPIGDLSGRKIAILEGYTPLCDSDREILDQHTQGASILAYGTRKYGLEIWSDHAELAYEKAARTLLDAIDSSAEVCVVTDTKGCAFLQTYRKKIASALNRDINIPIIHLSQALTALQKVEA